MANVNVKPDCGNAPKKQFLKELYIAFANADLSFVTDNISDDIVWEIVGKEKVSGGDNYFKELVDYKLWDIENMDIDTIITHGNEASVSGRVTTKDHLKFAFTDVYKFKGFGNTKIIRISTFLIQV